MSAEVQKQEKPKAESKQPVITSVTFNESVMFAGTERQHASLRVGPNIGTADSITPVCLKADGSFSRGGEAANGILLERKVTDRAGKETGVERVFVFAANTRGLTFG